MKKLFMFLAVASLATFGTSCSSNNDEPQPAPQSLPLLTLSADATDVALEELVTFTISSNGKAVEGAQLFDGTTKITSPHAFTTPGTHKITAQKEGFKTSIALSINVSESTQKQLNLAASMTDVKVGQEVSFIVKEGSNLLADATITSNTGEKVVDMKWTPTEVGTFTFIARREGSLDSNEVKIVVTELTNYFKADNQVLGTEETYALIRCNKKNVVLLYSGKYEDETPYYYIIYTLQSVADDINFTSVEFKAIVDTKPELVFMPQEAERLELSSGYAAIEGYKVATVDYKTEPTAELIFNSWSEEPAGQDQPGTVDYSLKAEQFELKYSGSYQGFYIQQKGLFGRNVTETTQDVSVSKVDLTKFELVSE